MRDITSSLKTAGDLCNLEETLNKAGSPDDFSTERIARWIIGALTNRNDYNEIKFCEVRQLFVENMAGDNESTPNDEDLFYSTVCRSYLRLEGDIEAKLNELRVEILGDISLVIGDIDATKTRNDIKDSYKQYHIEKCVDRLVYLRGYLNGHDIRRMAIYRSSHALAQCFCSPLSKAIRNAIGIKIIGISPWFALVPYLPVDRLSILREAAERQPINPFSTSGIEELINNYIVENDMVTDALRLCDGNTINAKQASIVQFALEQYGKRNDIFCLIMTPEIEGLLCSLCEHSGVTENKIKRAGSLPKRSELLESQSWRNSAYEYFHFILPEYRNVVAHGQLSRGEINENHLASMLLLCLHTC